MTGLAGSMLPLLDVHCHLGDDVFDQDRDAVIQRARDRGVRGTVVVSESERDFSSILDLAKRHPKFCFPCLGIHPVQDASQPNANHSKVMAANPDQVEHVRSAVERFHDRLVGVGEIGLDFTPWVCRNDSDRDLQRAVFRQQLAIAKRYDLPVNVHSRSTGAETIRLLREEGAGGVVLHNFAGRPSLALQAAGLGYHLSVAPAVLLHQEERRKLVSAIPLDRLLLETDSPALGPERGVRNEPANIALPLEYVARVKAVDIEVVARFAWDNAMHVFPKIKLAAET